MFRLNNRAACPHSTNRPYGHCSAFRLLVRSPPIMRGIPFLLSFGSITNHNLSSHSLFCFSENSVFGMRQLRRGNSVYGEKPNLGACGTLQDKVKFHLMIENTGRRNSTVNGYQVEIVELQQTFPNLRPVEGHNGIQGRHCQHGLQPASVLSTTGNIRIEAESTTELKSEGVTA